MSNRLSSESSPYLLQHAENPVDWYPWGSEAFDKARSEDKPVFLSVGYSACHWCHVMEHESFEDERTAALMNERFVSIKVDREERPDVDAIYMDAVQALTGHGGWPMSVFLTPDAEPFYGGTYFPDTSRFGMPSFTEVLSRIADLWTERRAELTDAASDLTQALASGALLGAVPDRAQPSTELLDSAVRALSRAFDREQGGWGDAPKFPQPAVHEFLLRRSLVASDAVSLEMVTRTLDAMLRGGIYDQLGGGFHRYATDHEWLVPHFEKMLYDNAQLARVYLHAWQITGDERYRRVVVETLDYVVREMRTPLGGFLSAQDADSEGVEGRYFVWTPEQIRDALAGAPGDYEADAELLMTAYGVTESGNFEGATILSIVRTASDIARDTGEDATEVQARLDRCREALRDAREKRVKPGIDDKVLAGWNGLMLGAFAEAARVLNREDYLDVAVASANFLLSAMRDADGRMVRTWKDGRAKLNGYLEDYATVADGLLELYQTTFDPNWFAAARELADAILDHFADENGGFFDTSDDHEALVLRPKGMTDGAMPSGAAMATGVLMRLAHYTGDRRYADAAEGALASARGTMGQYPIGLAHWLSVLDFSLSPREVAIVGEAPESLLDVVRARYRPDLVVAAGPSGADVGIALLADRDAADGHAAAYVCRQFACERPVTSPSELEALLDRRDPQTTNRAGATAR